MRDISKYAAPDGWVLEWRIHAIHGYVRVIDHTGVCISSVYGSVTGEMVADELALFREVHG